MAVYLSKQSTYSREAIKTATADLIAHFDISLSDFSSILLKPNFVVSESHKRGSTTHPDFYMAIAELLMDHGISVSIGDSPAFGSTRSTLKRHSVYKECLKKGIGIVEFKKTEEFEAVNESKKFRKLTVAAELKDFDAVINLPKLKVHQQFVFTGATKNLYGCVTGKRKAYRHFVCENNPLLFAQMILSNAAAVKPLLHIGDGITSMHKKGPRGGEPYPLHSILASESYLELDWAFCNIAGIPQDITPLFNALDDAEIEALIKATEAIPFTKRDDFLLSPESPIEFSATHMIRSVWKSLKTGSK